MLVLAADRDVSGMIGQVTLEVTTCVSRWHRNGAWRQLDGPMAGDDQAGGGGGNNEGDKKNVNAEHDWRVYDVC